MTNKYPKELQNEIDSWVNEATKWSFNRRQLVAKGAAIATGIVGVSVAGCKTPGSISSTKDDATDKPRKVRIECKKFNRQTKSFDVMVIMVTGSSIYYDYEKIILQEIRVTAAPSATNDDFKYQVVQHASAAASLIKYYLDNEPYTRLFPELFAHVESSVFRPNFGPYIAFRHQDVIDILQRPDMFTVDLYAPNMAVSTSGHPKNGHKQPPDQSNSIPEDEIDDYQPQWKPVKKIKPDGKNSFYNHYMLGTDQNDLYTPDSRIARHVVTKADIPMLRPMIRKICEDLVKGIRPGQTFDVIGTIGRYAPVMVVMEYLGLPSFAKQSPGSGFWNIKQNGKSLVGGGSFEVPQSFQNRFTIEELKPSSNGRLMSIVPDHKLAYEWIRDGFRMIFNNFSDNPDFKKKGMIANERLLAWSALVIEFYKEKIANGETVPDTMITRLIKLQRDALADKPKYAALFGCDEDDLVTRVADDRIQVNAFGAFVGAVANPEEANGRIIEELFKLKLGETKALNGSYAEVKTAAMQDDTDTLNKYAIEFLRLNPQGEILLRKCLDETKLRSGEGIPKGTTIFTAHGAAMRDPSRISDPNKFDVKRQDRKEKYNFDVRTDSSDPDRYVSDRREGDDEQSLVYLHHGFGRHKCLGRYASEITMEEVLRAVLRLGDLDRVDEKMTMDSDGLYSVKFNIKVS